jgi:hypothetical protein
MGMLQHEWQKKAGVTGRNAIMSLPGDGTKKWQSGKRRHRMAT